MWRVGFAGSEERVWVGVERWMPECVRRRVAVGMLVRRVRSVERVEMVVDAGSVREIVFLPETSLTKRVVISSWGEGSGAA